LLLADWCIYNIDETKKATLRVAFFVLCSAKIFAYPFTATTSSTKVGNIFCRMLRMPFFNVMVEEGQPEQAP
jgi:hypothetical protein